MSATAGTFMVYVGRAFALRFIGLLLFFVLLLQMLDLLNNSSTILAVEGAGFPQMARYVSLRAPEIASQFTPFAALLAIVVTLAGLSHTSEITVMRAAGMSVHRVLFPLGFACALVAIAHFIFHETVTVKSSQALDYWNANGYALDLPEDTGTRTNIRIESADEFVKAQSAAQVGDGVLMRDLTIYGFDNDGLTNRVIEASAARFEEGVWRLYRVSLLDAESLEKTTEESVVWTNPLDPDLLFALSIKPDQTPIVELARKIAQLREDNADTGEAMTSLLSRASKPMATLVMPLLGAIAGFGIHRQGVLLARAVSGASLGFSYFLAENLALAFGKLGVVPAFIGAFFPFALFMVVGFSILLAMEN
ncbi:MAG: LPS export ABC transporter permease LptG [Pseudomonadota bacterium]